MNKILSVIILCCSVFFISCVSSQVVTDSAYGNMPDWVYNPRNIYSDNNFLTYVGTGADRESAELFALSGISAIFGQDVIVDSKASERMELAAADGIVAYADKKTFGKEVSSKVNVDNLVGVEIKDYWFDGDKTWYAIAVLDKAKACELYKSMIQKNSATINNLINYADKDLYSLQSLCAYDFAQEIAIENKNNLDRLFVVNHDFAKGIASSVISPDSLAKKKVEIANAIPVNINIEGDEKGTYTSALLDSLSDFGFSGSTDKDVRYVIEGKVSYTYEVTTDGKTHKVYYDFESSLMDTLNGVNVFPINIRGMKAHRTATEAENRVKQDIIRKIESTFDEQFNNYLDSYSGI